MLSSYGVEVSVQAHIAHTLSRNQDRLKTT